MGITELSCAQPLTVGGQCLGEAVMSSWDAGMAQLVTQRARKERIYNIIYLNFTLSPAWHLKEEEIHFINI